MPAFLGAAGAFLLVLLAVFIVGRLWFALVETVRDAIARRLTHKEPEAWHPLPPDGEEKP